MKTQNRIAKAIQNTKKISSPPHPNYWEATLNQRQPGGTGSVFLHPVTESEILRAVWEPFSHPSLLEGTEAFKASIPGLVGVVDISTLPPMISVTLDDRKGTGWCSCVVDGACIERIPVNFTVLILGQEDGEEVVFTLHPGDPVPASRVEISARHGKIVTAKEALEMGFKWAKVQ